MRQPNSSPTHGRQPQEHENYPVHLIGRIQPHGVLMELHGAELHIVRVSQTIQNYLGASPADVLNQPLSAVLDPIALAAVQQSLSHDTNRPSHLTLSVSTPEGMKPFDGLIHQLNEQIILELEPVGDRSTAEMVALHDSVRQAIARLRQIQDVTTFLQAAVEEMQSLTGYDRVVIYQFDEKKAGSVVAEVKPFDDIAYKGLHYPATDIPKLVRQLYQRGMIRYVANLTAPQVELVAPDLPLPKAPLNLTLSTLRGVDSCCIEYHQNMGVMAFLVIALVKSEQLWGLMACHHRTEKYLAYPVRSACEILGQFVAAELVSKVNEEELGYFNRLKAIQSDFVTAIAGAEDFKEALIHPEPRLLDLVNAHGTAVCLDQDITLIGNTPTLDQVRALLDWSMTEIDQTVFHTDCLSNHYPAALAFKESGSGLLVLKISQLRRYLVLWFRPEILQTVNWAGDPRSSIHETQDGQVLLGPRTSFRQWQETVEATALPWKAAEIESAENLKNAIVGIVLNKADELAQINLELERRNQELDSFAYAASHDLKEPLRGIINFANIIIKRYGESLDEAGVRRLRTLVKLAQRMDTLVDTLLKFSRLGQADLHYRQTDLQVLVQKAIDVLLTGREGDDLEPQIDIPRPLPTVDCDQVLISEAFGNLLGNALKYTDKAQPLIEIGYLTPEEQRNKGWREISQDYPLGAVFYVKDDGIGIRERHFQNIFRLFKRLHEQESYGGGTGVGLTITKRIIERHGGCIWVESTFGEGATFYFTLLGGSDCFSQALAE
ncbi:ATP-binding protein [Oscillatoria sp. CS-180]|uniref:ATP-binding protein n=1 Tax=Oscillatoria sp. CS-180 TaxID=3021720 RepID=UPI00232A8ABF|nr:ATP-binding protein [Oscillatoria sp. CS-180]MDB9525334.1 ATP-binding protein [Oscillatoria sp. CS-180]